MFNYYCMNQGSPEKQTSRFWGLSVTLRVGPTVGSVCMNREQAERVGPNFRGDVRLTETENSGDDHRRKGQEDTEKSCDQIFWFKGFVCPEETGTTR